MFLRGGQIQGETEMKKLALFLLALLPLCASAGPLELLGVTQSPSDVCNPNSLDEIRDCPNGQKMFFQPSRWGSEQLPLLVIAGYCDTTKPVFFNNSGVVCTKIPFTELVNPKTAKIKAEWKLEFDKIRTKDSGWLQADDNLWIRVLKSPNSKVPERPFKLEYEANFMEADGSSSGTRPEIDSLFITENSDSFLASYSAGTVLECFRYFADDYQKNQRFTIEIKEEISQKRLEMLQRLSQPLNQPKQSVNFGEESGNDVMTNYQKAQYLNRIVACIRPHITFNTPAGAKPGQYVSLFEVNLLNNGRQSGKPKLLQSSGLAAYDSAVERAILRCNPFPIPEVGGAPKIIQLKFDPVDPTSS